MVITYLGEGCFRLQSGEGSLLVDPGNNRLKADVVLRTIVSPNLISPVHEIVFPGEYEAKGMEIRGLPVPSESTEKFLKTIYVVEWEDMRLTFLGHLSRMPDADLVEHIAESDVLFVPTGGAHFIAPHDAANLIKQVEPALVIPAFYKSYSELLKAMGTKDNPQEKFVFRKKDLEGKKAHLVVLQAKSS